MGTRLRWRIALAAGVVGALVFAASAPAAVTDSYCSPTGDYCTAVNKTANGRVKLKIGTFSFRGHYQLCVGHPGSRAHCRRERLSKHGDLWIDKVDFAANFPHGYSGRYRVTWHKFGRRLGRPLHFNFG